MVDLHSHIIPNIDDGSKSVEETFSLIKEAKDVGFNEIVFTSHYMEQYYEAPEVKRQTWINGISQGLEKEKLDVKIYQGSEIYFSENITKLLEERKASTINGTSYVLFETALNSKPLNLFNIIYELQEKN